MIYLDNNATTHPAPSVRERVAVLLNAELGNPSARYASARQAAEIIEEARQSLCDLAGGVPSEWVFTSGGSESIASAFYSSLQAVDFNRKHAIVVSAGEHPTTLGLTAQAEKQHLEVRVIRLLPSGELDLDHAFSLIDEDALLISVMAVNNETGVIFPWQEVEEMAIEVNALMHLDAVQAPGKIPLDLRAHSGVSFASLSAHKLHGISGCGALRIRKGVRFAPLLAGGHQEKGRRAGTENVLGIAALGEAARLAAVDAEDQTSLSEKAALRDHLERALVERCDGVVHGAQAERVWNTTSIALPGVQAKRLIELLDAEGVCVAAGSACTTGSLEPSHVLLNMGVEEELARATLRLSLSRYTTRAEIDTAIEKIAAACARLRA